MSQSDLIKVAALTLWVVIYIYTQYLYLGEISDRDIV